MEKKDILFLCQYFYPEYVSSATLPYDTAKALVKAGFSVSALCGYPREYNKSLNVPKKEIHEGIKIKRLKYIQLKRSNFLGRLINYFSFTFSVFLRFFSLKKYKSIIVYSNPPVLPLIASLASKLFKSKMIFVCYDVYPEMAHVTNSISKDGFISKMMRFINKKTYKHVNKVIALSGEMKEYLLNNRKDINDKQVVVIPNWHEDITEENADELKQVNNSNSSNGKFSAINSKDNFIVSYFGNLGICQDMDTMLGAIRKLRAENKIKFMFAGHGNKMDQLKKTVKEENLDNVFIYDFLHGEDFKYALNISDCFMVTLTEGLTGLAVPSKTYSYMMAGKPIIAVMGTNSDIAKDLVDNKAGYAMEAGEVDKLVDSIRELKSSQSLRKEMGINVRKVFKENYTTEKCTQKYVHMMKEILGKTN